MDNSSRVKKYVTKLIHLVFKPIDKKFTKLDDSEYYASFGIEMKDGKYSVGCPKKIERAYEKAWENRDYEINKFWTRAAYFWAFIVLIFGAYFKVVTEKELDDSYFLQLCLICTGIIFSFAWYHVIKGSKHWQENWEYHIDKLEDFVSGPLYKTIYYQDRFFSVSKINEILSVLIIFLWSGILFNFLTTNHNFPWNDNSIWRPNYLIIFLIFITIIFCLSIFNGYSSKTFDVKDTPTFIKRKPFANSMNENDSD